MLARTQAPRDVAPCADAGRTACRAARKATQQLLPDQTAVVIGAGGPGHIDIQALSAMRTARIIVVDTSDVSLLLAAQHGANHPYKSDGGKVDTVLAVIEFVAEKGTTRKCPDMTRPTGRDYIVGNGKDLRVPTGDMVTTQKNTVGNLVGTWAELTELIADGSSRMPNSSRT